MCHICRFATSAINPSIWILLELMNRGRPFTKAAIYSRTIHTPRPRLRTHARPNPSNALLGHYPALLLVLRRFLWHYSRLPLGSWKYSHTGDARASCGVTAYERGSDEKQAAISLVHRD